MEETLAETRYDTNGKRRYSGKRKQMRESEEYPVRWCVKEEKTKDEKPFWLNGPFTA